MMDTNNRIEDPSRYGSINKLKYFVDIRQFGRAAKILELYAPQLKKVGKEDLAKSFLEKSALFYSKIGWFEKTYGLYSSIQKLNEAKKAILKRDKLQEKFEMTINEEYKNKDDSLFNRIKKEKIAQLWEQEKYDGRAAIFQYDLGNINKAQALIEKEGLDLVTLCNFVKECSQLNIIIEKFHRPNTLF